MDRYWFLGRLPFYLALGEGSSEGVGNFFGLPNVSGDPVDVSGNESAAWHNKPVWRVKWF